MSIYDGIKAIMSMGSPILWWDMYFLNVEIKLIMPVLSCYLAQVAFLFNQEMFWGKITICERGSWKCLVSVLICEKFWPKIGSLGAYFKNL